MGISHVSTEYKFLVLGTFFIRREGATHCGDGGKSDETGTCVINPKMTAKVKNNRITAFVK